MHLRLSRWSARFSVLLVALSLLAPSAEAASRSRARRPASSKVASKVASKAASKRVATAKKSRGRAARSSRRPRARYSARLSSARRAKLERARAASRARELRDVLSPKYRLDAYGAQIPDLRAAAGIIFNPVTGEVLWEQNSQDPRSIASITKVMTAVVFLEDSPDLTREVTVERPDVYSASTTYLRAGESLRVSDLLHLLLIASDNAAARALARVSRQGTQGFIERMNTKAAELGLTSSRFADPSGLDPANVASAYDLSRLIAYASADERIAPIMRTSQYAIQTSRRVVRFNSTNRLLGGDVDVRGGKTGFIRNAGYCLATMLKMPQGDQVAVVVLGARSNAGRFMETKHLFNWFSTKLFSKPQPDQPQP